MPFAFLMPAFLAAVLAVAIPVMLHLRRRDRSKPAPFPSLMFLTRREIQTDQRRAVSDWPLLLLRALVIALLVLVFARPFLNRPLTATDPSIGLTVLVLDRSESMGHTAVADRWQDSARAVVSGLPGDARIAVVAFDAAARILVKPTTDHAQALAAIEAAPSPAGGTRFGSGLAAASQLLALERVPGEIVVVTDLQRSGTAATNAPALPAGTRVRVVPIQAAELGNLAVIDVGIEALPDDGNRRALVVARLRRVGGDAMHTVTARLQVDGREVAAVPVAVEPGGSQQVVFDTISVSRAAVRVAVSIDADDFTADDTFFAVLPPVTTTRITLVTPREASQAEFHHLVQALSIGRDPEFAIARVAALDAETIRESAAIILADVAPPDGQLGEALADAVNSGTGMILMVGRRLASRTGVLPLVPSRIRDVVVNIDGDGLDMASSGHPAIAAFSTSRSGALAGIRIRRRSVVVADPADEVLIRYENGDPALLVGVHGSGRRALLAIPVDATAGTFPLSTAFLPLVRGVVTWASGQAAPALSFESGLPVGLPAGLVSPTFRTPAGDLLRPDGNTTRFASFRERGIHEVLEGAGSDLSRALVAINAPASESDLTPVPPDELLLGITESPPVTALSAPETTLALEAQQRGWRWLIVALILALMAEVILASRGWRRRSIRVPAAFETGGQRS